MTTMLLLAATAVTAYVGPIFTWPRLLRVIVVVEAEIELLRAKIAAIETRLRG